MFEMGFSSLQAFTSVACKASFAVSVALNQNDADSLVAKTRNIGIIAHIDAGKTTTTERMLYYGGYTRRIGDVDDGSTVTDFLPAERARGITIQSAAITFRWPPSSPDQKGGHSPESYTINIIDTPGHADFTFEVVRSLRILDGAVCILDGVAGVEAQTEKVWYQARNYQIPKIIFVNKLDRDGAAFGKTVKEIAAKLHAWPAVCQIPWFEDASGRFQGVVDIINMRALQWPNGGDGKSVRSYGMAELENIDSKLANEARKARAALVELLSGHDDLMVEKFLEADEDHLSVSAADITASLRRSLLTSDSTIVPVFAGASFRNIGVQPLIDVVTALLPNPTEAPDPEISAGPVSGRLGQLMSGKLDILPGEQKSKKAAAKKPSGPLVKNIEACALAFKVVNDAKRGLLVYVRVYQGALTKTSIVWNTNLQTSERMPRLLKMYANDAVETDSIPAGQIGVITGLKHARTGDTLITYTGTNPKTGPPAPLNQLQLRPIDVPPPVFFASIEPQSLGEEKPVAEALALLLREDPSLQISTDEDSGQTHLSGMGELHLEIARDRLIQDLKAKATMGKIEIGYRETITTPADPVAAIYDRETSGKASKAGCLASVSPLQDPPSNPASHPSETTSTLHRDGNLITTTILATASPTLETSSLNLPTDLPATTIHTSLQNGALAALSRGPKYAYPLHSTSVHLTLDPPVNIFPPHTTPAALSSAARLAVSKALRKSSTASPTALMEPVMNVLLSVDEASLGAVVHDISSSRGGQILSLDDADATTPDNLSGSGSGSLPGLSVTREDVRLIDTRMVYAPPDPFAAPSVEGGGELDLREGNRNRVVTARVPLKEMVGYLKVLRSCTGGRGTFVMSVDRFERMGSQREKALVRKLRGI
ncbi:MAG: Ribosome-releasing factor 2, mitochondrial [Stictis urceolatum]|nr:Ribosome-releasing factor 2, mitochondrial [Stictis urceolata]